MERISIREYARQLGCTDTAVRKAIAAGKIVDGVVDRDTPRPKIIAEVANREWGQYFKPNYGHNPALAERFVEPAKAPAPVAKTAPKPAPKPKPKYPAFDALAVENGWIEDDADAADTGTDEDGGKVPFAELQRRHEAVKLRIAELNLQARRGELVETAKVYAALFSAGQEMRTAFLAVPDRIIDDLLAAPGRNEAHSLLYRAIASVLESFADISNRDLTQ
jgi:hypothetical protein